MSLASSPRFRVRVPATSANLGPGFDCMGIALDLFNEITLEPNLPFEINASGAFAKDIPTDETNSIVQTVNKLLNVAKSDAVPTTWCLNVQADIPVAAGLGSSASAIVGGALLANALLSYYDPKHVLSRQQLLAEVTALEGHPDNVTPALLGGAWISIVNANGIQSFPLPVPQKLTFVVAVPDFQLHTERARMVVKSYIALPDAVFNVAQASRLTLALSTNQLDLLRHDFSDKLHEPHREHLIPGIHEVRSAALRLGAYAVTISGAGPSLLAWCDENNEEDVAQAMSEAWAARNIMARTYKVRPTRIETSVVINENTEGDVNQNES